MRDTTLRHLDTLVERLPVLGCVREEILSAAQMIVQAHFAGGKVMVCGNGGSAADSEHIAGELMKGFLLTRRPPEEDMAKLRSAGAEHLGKVLQKGIKAIALTGHVSLTTAVINDTDPLMTFAQQVYVYACLGDVLIGLSTSGNAPNVVNALTVAKAFGVKTIGLTGSRPSKISEICDVTIKAPQQQTHLVQEMHLPIYHAICAMAEEEVFGK